MSGNNMQQIFDALATAGEDRLTMAELCARVLLDHQSVRAAVDDLVRGEIVFRTGRHNTQRYGLVPGALRPVDRRGKKEGGACRGQ